MSERWYKTSSGASLLETEKQKLAQVLSTLYGYYLLQVAPPSFWSCITSSLILNRFNTHTQFIARDDALPILSDSVDVVVLTHTLEQSRTLGCHPHQILREAYRVLIPGGHIVITGINPFSYWGCKLLMLDFQTKLITRSKLKDWLSLLDFELVHASPFSVKSFFEPIYVLVAVKRLIPLTLIKPTWSQSQLAWVQGEKIS